METPTIKVATFAELVEERAQQRRSHLVFRGMGRPRRSSVLTDRQRRIESKRDKRFGSFITDPEYVSKQPDANRQARRAYGIHFVVGGTANQPYRRPFPKGVLLASGEESE